MPVAQTVRKVSRARASGNRVIFVSDTPHSERFIRELLVHHGVADPDELVFTSADRGVSKSAGGLFTRISESLGPSHTFEHVGDNKRSDVASARLEGWSGALVPDGQLTRYEKLLEHHANETSGFTSWMAGASRVARLEYSCAGVSQPLGSVAAGVMAPMLVGYAHWVVSQARLRGIQRLYYVARDGEVMMRVAEEIIGRLAPDIELRYLYGSRQAWTLGACALSDDILRRWVQTKADHSPRTALARVHLTPDHVYRATGLEFCSASSSDSVMTAKERKLLAGQLLEPPLIDAVRQSARGAAERALAYLEQEGLCDGVPSALVDAGWGGRTAGAFDCLLRSVGVVGTTHLVMGITGNEDDAKARADVNLVPWLFDQQTYPESVAGFPSANVMVEMFCASTSGRTLDYERSEGLVVPLKQVERNDPVERWGMPLLQEIALRVVDSVVDRVPEPGTIDCRPFVWDVMRAFWMRPTRTEATAWGDFPWEEEVAQPFVPIAQRVSVRTVSERVRRGEMSMRRSNSWRAGSAAVSGQPWRGLLRARTLQEEMRPRLARAPRRICLALSQRR